MPVPNTTGQGQEPAIERGGLIAAGLGDAAQAFGPADSVFGLYPAAWAAFWGRWAAVRAVSGLALGQAFGRQVVVGDQAQVAQIG